MQTYLDKFLQEQLNAYINKGTHKLKQKDCAVHLLINSGRGEEKKLSCGFMCAQWSKYMSSASYITVERLNDDCKPHEHNRTVCVTNFINEAETKRIHLFFCCTLTRTYNCNSIFCAHKYVSNTHSQISAVDLTLVLHFILVFLCSALLAISKKFTTNFQFLLRTTIA